MSVKTRFSTLLNRLHIKDVQTTLFNYVVSVKRTITVTFPAWVTSRPKAFKQWRKNDRKKKKYRSFRLQKKLRPEPRYIPSSYKLLRSSISFMWKNKRVFFYVFCIHTIIYVTVIRPPVSTNFEAVRSSIDSVLGEDSQKTAQGVVATLGSVLGFSAGNQSNTGIIAGSILLMSLVYVWAIRELHARNKIKARDAYYKGMSPLVPASIVLMVMSLQLVPFGFATFVYTTARSGAVFANGFEDLSFFIVTILIAILSLFWLTSTIIAFYIVTLPGMYPIKSLRVAKKLVQFQRFKVFKRIVAVPVIFGLAYLLILTFVIRFLPSQVFFTVDFLQLLFLPLIHIYLYKLYRSLI